MLRFFFHHRSHAVDIVGMLGVIALAAMPWRMALDNGGAASWIVLGIAVAEYGFIRYCAAVRWYTDAARFEGIELQFKKAVSPTAYIVLFGGILFQIVPSTIVTAVMATLLAVIAHVNAILIYLHLRDRHPLPVNYFSHNKSGTEYK